jgi:NitT/TauT family transport system substrate-binding protein
VIEQGGMKSTADMLTKFDPELKGASIDLSKTFDDRFVKKAAGQ